MKKCKIFTNTCIPSDIHHNKGYQNTIVFNEKR